jgi:hypothetical protein
MSTLPIPDEQAALATLLREHAARGDGREPLSIETLGQYTCFCKLRAFCADKTADSCLRERNLYQAFVETGS